MSNTTSSKQKAELKTARDLCCAALDFFSKNPNLYTSGYYSTDVNDRPTAHNAEDAVKFSLWGFIWHLAPNSTGTLNEIFCEVDPYPFNELSSWYDDLGLQREQIVEILEKSIKLIDEKLSKKKQPVKPIAWMKILYVPGEAERKQLTTREDVKRVWEIEAKKNRHLKIKIIPLVPQK